MNYYFSILLSLFVLFLSLPVFGSDSCQLPVEGFAVASSKMIEKDYKGAVDASMKAPDSAMRDFLLGMAMTKTGEWDRAAEYLGKASANFPLLADYATFNRAYSLSRLARYPEVQTLLQLFVDYYPDSPLLRSALKLQADNLYISGNFQGASDAYEKFIGKFPSGPDSLDALYKSARCSEETGNIPAALNILKKLWLNHPASSIAEIAGEELQRLTGKSNTSSLFSPEELMRRGAVLYDQGRYDKAAETFSAIPREKQNNDFICRLLLKTGQSKFRSRRFSSAEETFNSVLAKSPDGDIANEARFWQAKTLDKIGNEDAAFAIYENLAISSPGSPLADDALLAAYFIGKFQNRGSETQHLLKTLETNYPHSNLLQTANWEIAWQSYLACDFKTAALYFKKSANDHYRREKALYWYSRSLKAAGDNSGADKALIALFAEFPSGYYALTFGKDRPLHLPGQEAVPSAKDIRESRISTEPSGFERAKALIALGLYEEARKELNWSKKRNLDNATALRDISRLYLKMGDFNRSSSMISPDTLRKHGKISSAEWGMAYPLAYSDQVTVNASEFGIAESLVYSIMRAESNYSPSAVSPSGAIGLMQVMPATAAAITKSVVNNGICERLGRPELNIRLGVKHLKGLLELYDGDIVMAVAAYNAGAGNVNRWVKRLGKVPNDLFIESIPFAETREYVKKVLAGAEIYNRLYKIPAPMTPDTRTIAPSPKELPPVKPSPDISERGISSEKRTPSFAKSVSPS